MSFRERLVFDEATGEYRDGDARYLFIRNDALMGVFAGLPAEQGQAALRSLARSVRSFGGRSVAAYRASGSGSPEQMLRTIAQTAPQLGWGSWTFTRHGDDDISLEIRNSPFAAGAGRTGRPVCHAVVGMLSALGPVLFGTEAHAQEDCCASVQPGAACRFRVTPGTACEPAEGMV